MQDSEPLTAAEASFVALDQPEAPMHIAALILLKGSPPLTTHELRRLVSTRLRRVRRFHQRVRWPFGGRRPVWERARRLVPAEHFFRHTLPPSTGESHLLDLCARIHQEPLSYDRPLWEMHLIDGMPGGRQALFIKAHHAMGDGLAGIQIAELLFDPAPGAPRPQLPVTHFATRKHGSPWRLFEAILGLAVAAAGGPLAPEGPFNGRVGRERAFGIATLPMPAIRRVKRQLGVTVDDVLAATVACGIARYLREVRYPRAPARLRAMVPVSTRGAHSATTGNHVSAVFLDLPIDTEDMATALDRIVKQKQSLRNAHTAAGGSLLVDLIALLPTPLQSGALRMVSKLPFANLIVSDIPGPRQDLYLLGRRIVGCYPMTPLAPSLGLSIAAVSMSGVMGIGVTADPSLVPDVQQLARAVERAWAAVAEPGRLFHRRRAA